VPGLVLVTTLSYELDFWADCLDTLGEERKHMVYAPLMGVSFDLEGRSVLDIGGGPVSMLLKCRNRGRATVLDPLMYEFPSWVRSRYYQADIAVLPYDGEDLILGGYDEAWIYNVLQHVHDPERVIENAQSAAQVVRVFEWIDIPAYEGHPHMLTQDLLEEWLGGPGMTVNLAEDGCHGRAFYGAFL
jgi:hypothetical protein